MGEVIEGWADAKSLGIFAPNCPTDLVQMEPDGSVWRCAECGLAQFPQGTTPPS